MRPLWPLLLAINLPRSPTSMCPTVPQSHCVPHCSSVPQDDMAVVTGAADLITRNSHLQTNCSQPASQPQTAIYINYSVVREGTGYSGGKFLCLFPPPTHLYSHLCDLSLQQTHSTYCDITETNNAIKSAIIKQQNTCRPYQ